MEWMYDIQDWGYGPYDNMNYFDQTYNIWDGGKMKEDSRLDPIIRIIVNFSINPAHFI